MKKMCKVSVYLYMLPLKCIAVEVYKHSVCSADTFLHNRKLTEETNDDGQVKQNEKRTERKNKWNLLHLQQYCVGAHFVYVRHCKSCESD